MICRSKVDLESTDQQINRSILLGLVFVQALSCSYIRRLIVIGRLQTRQKRRAVRCAIVWVLDSVEEVPTTSITPRPSRNTLKIGPNNPYAVSPMINDTLIRMASTFKLSFARRTDWCIIDKRAALKTQKTG